MSETTSTCGGAVLINNDRQFGVCGNPMPCAEHANRPGADSDPACALCGKPIVRLREPWTVNGKNLPIHLACPEIFGRDIIGATASEAEPRIAPNLTDALSDLGREYGPLGVALAAARMTSVDALVQRLTNSNAAPVGEAEPVGREITITVLGDVDPDHPIETEIVDAALAASERHGLDILAGSGPAPPLVDERCPAVEQASDDRCVLYAGHSEKHLTWDDYDEPWRWT